MQSFATRDEQEVAGYAEAMDLVFQAYEDFRLTENHINQLHQTLLRHSEKDEHHRGAYPQLTKGDAILPADAIAAKEQREQRCTLIIPAP